MWKMKTLKESTNIRVNNNTYEQGLVDFVQRVLGGVAVER